MTKWVGPAPYFGVYFGSGEALRPGAMACHMVASGSLVGSIDAASKRHEPVEYTYGIWTRKRRTDEEIVASIQAHSDAPKIIARVNVPSHDKWIPSVRIRPKPVMVAKDPEDDQRKRNHNAALLALLLAS